MRSSKGLSKIPKSVVLHAGLILKQLDGSDTEDLFSLTNNNRAYLQKWLPWVDTCISQSDALNFITSTHNALWENSRLTFGIFYKGKIAGVIGFNRVDLSSGQAEIGYWIGEAFQGLGMVTSACTKLLAIGFHQLALNSISIKCAIDNGKSQNIPIRLGFEKSDHVLKEENVQGIYMDIIVYTMQRNQWENNQVKS